MDADSVASIEGNLIRNHADKNIIKILSISSSPAVKEGANFLSIVDRVKITVLRQSGRKEKISLIIKKTPKEEGRQAFVVESGAFKREIMIYTRVLHSMEKLMVEFDDNEGKLWCDLVAFNPYDEIVFEDLMGIGFKMTESRHDFLNLDHSILVMQALGRFHALSKVLIKKRIIEPNEFAPHFVLGNPKNTEMVFVHCLKGFGRHVKSWGTEWVQIGNIFIDYASRLATDCEKIGKAPEGSNLIVMNHGDVWTCNILFKYSRYSQAPIDLRFIDFQLCHYNTAGYDLTYFLFGSVNPQVRRAHYDLLLNVYVHEMKTTAAIYGLPSEQLPEIDDLKADIKRILPFRLVTTFFFRPLFVSRFPFDMEAIVTNVEMVESIGQDINMLSDPNFKEKSEDDLKEIGAELAEVLRSSP
ncbi:transferase activity, transferring phosphorus-containing groups [Nesidiocoris tenuis]|uniref:Transferase activity, transferring phosphorus-containing groups n=1 Tax=Nesidiocoris tenuis TaxID=355587 RepID=A0ABN7AZ49_9HEMI|nr:transferase activity, transferring phosphorus-containing groups [Nesidiocoris tenuis]